MAQDGNYIAVDIASQDGEHCNYIDCFHETFAMPGQSTIVAGSFAELLDRALRGGRAPLLAAGRLRRLWRRQAAFARERGDSDRQSGSPAEGMACGVHC
jgi:hypothetical protein